MDRATKGTCLVRDNFRNYCEKEAVYFELNGHEIVHSFCEEHKNFKEGHTHLIKVCDYQKGIFRNEIVLRGAKKKQRKH